MREEIRKLFPLEFYINNKGEMVSEISLKTLNKLSDEIIKLEEENEELKAENEKLTQLWLDSQEKRRKAIDKISKLKPFIPNEIPSWLDELENILKGGDDNE